MAKEAISNYADVNVRGAIKDDPRDFGDRKFNDIQVADVQSRVLNDNGIPKLFDNTDYFMFFDDFITIPLDDTTGFPTGWTIVSDDAGTTGDAIDAEGGWLGVAVTNTDNNETYLSNLGESFKFTTTKKLWFETKVKLTEANIDDANWIIGLSDNAAADFLQDDGKGPAASYDGAVFFKVDGKMTVQFETSNAATQVTNANLGTFTSATAVRLGFFYDYNDGVTGYITPYINGVAGNRHAITISGLEEMHIVMGVKAGGAKVETLLVDYIKVVQER